MGNVNNNQAIFYLYANHFTRVDGTWPGPNGFVVQAVKNPYRTRYSVVVVGGSDLDGTAQAAAYLMEQLKQAKGGTNIVLPLQRKIVVDSKTPDPGQVGGDDDHMRFQNHVGAFLNIASLGAVQQLAKDQLDKSESIFDRKHYRGIGVLVARDLISALCAQTERTADVVESVCRMANDSHDSQLLAHKAENTTSCLIDQTIGTALTATANRARYRPMRRWCRPTFSQILTTSTTMPNLNPIIPLKPALK